MGPAGKKHSGKSGKPPVEDQLLKVCDLEKKDKGVSGSEEEVSQGTEYLMQDIDDVLQFTHLEPTLF
jgi:hypothetical protein